MNVYQLEPITVCKGSSLNPEFIFVNKDNSIPDYSEYHAYFILSPYGFEDENILSIEMDKVEKNKFVAIINTTYTEDIEEGTYTIKVVLVDKNGNQYRYARGILNILKDTKEVGVTI